VKVKIDGIFESNKLVDPFTWRDSMDKGTIVHYCIDNNKMSILKKVLDNEPKLNALLDQKLIDIPNRYNQTPVHLAVLEKKDLFAKFLITKKCNQNIVDKEGKTLYHYAIMGGYKGIGFEKHSPYILCSYGKEKLLVVVVECLNNETVKEINQKIKEYKLKKVKVYMRRSVETDLINATTYIGERSSMGENAHFICYL